MLDKNLRRKKKQPKFIKSGDHINVLKMVESMRNDNGHYARTSAMLQACGGFRYNTIQFLNFMMTFILLFVFRLTNHQLLINYINIRPPEKNNHKCRLLHHGQPGSKLAPFKLGKVSIQKKWKNLKKNNPTLLK